MDIGVLQGGQGALAGWMDDHAIDRLIPREARFVDLHEPRSLRSMIFGAENGGQGSCPNNSDGPSQAYCT